MLIMAEDGQEGEKERVTLHSSFIVVLYGASRWWFHVNCQWANKSDEELKKEQTKRMPGQVIHL
jgi:hypothetical protein